MPLDPHQVTRRIQSAALVLKPRIACCLHQPRPPDWVPAPQVASYVVFSFAAAGVYAFFVPFVEPASARIALLVVYTVLVAMVFSLAAVARCVTLLARHFSPTGCSSTETMHVHVHVCMVRTVQRTLPTLACTLPSMASSTAPSAR